MMNRNSELFKVAVGSLVCIEQKLYSNI